MAAPKIVRPKTPKKKGVTNPGDTERPPNPRARRDTQRQKYDWERIRRDYATGRYTDVELSRRHGPSTVMISLRRTRERAADPSAWPIDRSQEVTRAANALLLKSQTDHLAAGKDAEAVLVAAHMTKDVILGHRAELRNARDIAGRLLSELDGTTTHKDKLAAILEATVEGLDDDAKLAMRTQFREFMKLHSRVASIQKLADSLQRLQTQERKAFGIKDDEGTANPLDVMTERELEAELQRLGQQLAKMDARIDAATAGQAELPAPEPTAADGPAARVH